MQETVTLNGLTKWRENRFWTFYHGSWNFTIFHTSLSPQTSHELLAWVLNLDLRLDHLPLVFLTIKYRISVIASVCITNLLINLTTRTSILNCTLKQDGILLGKILYKIRQELLENFNQIPPRWTNNLTFDEQQGLHELKENPTVRVLATDKNLGPALVSTDWVEKENLTHLNDTKSYAEVTKDDWTFRPQKAIETRDKLVNSYSRFLPPNSLKFLRSLDDSPRSIDPAKFYIIPKIHKSPIAGRPIAPSHSYIIRPISIFVDELVKPNITMPTVLRDSGELIQCLEKVELPANCFLVTADVSSLYPNI